MKNRALNLIGAMAILLLSFSCSPTQLVTGPDGIVIDVQGTDVVLVMFKDVMKKDRYVWNWFYVPGSGLVKGDKFEFTTIGKNPDNFHSQY